MRHKILFLFLFISPTIVLSQANFRKGFVITTARDTINGYIDFKEGSKSFEGCVFKKSLEGATQSYSPSDLVGYGFIDDRFFESKQVEKENAFELVFIEVLVKGSISLYRLNGMFWVEKTGLDGLRVLKNEEKEVVVNGQQYVRNSNEYIGVLNSLLSDCQQAAKSINKTPLTEKPLTALIEDYNNCMGANAKTFKEKKPWFKMSVGIAGGVNISQLNFTTIDPAYDHIDGAFEKSVSPMIGATLDILSPRVSERFSFHGSVLYSKAAYYKYTYSQDFSNVRDYVTIEFSQIKVPMGFRYTFREKKITPYINAGFSLTFHLNYWSDWFQETEIGNVVTTKKSEAIEEKSSQFGFWSGLGAQLSVSRKLNTFLELRYEATNGLLTPSEPTRDTSSSGITNFQIVVGIRTK